MAIPIGKPVPDIVMPATGGKYINLSKLKGKYVVLYFYPKDNTPGCTREGQDFRDNRARFTRCGAVILGVSRDSLKSHERFKEKQGLPFDLVSDEEESLCRLFGVIKEKIMYGRKARGIERSTFLIDDQGILRHEWRKVKIDGHVAEVLETLESLQGGH